MSDISAQFAVDEIEKKVSEFANNDPYLKDHAPKLTWNGFFLEGYILKPGSDAEATL